MLVLCDRCFAIPMTGTCGSKMGEKSMKNGLRDFGYHWIKLDSLGIDWDHTILIRWHGDPPSGFLDLQLDCPMIDQG